MIVRMKIGKTGVPVQKHAEMKVNLMVQKQGHEKLSGKQGIMGNHANQTYCQKLLIVG